MTFGTFQMQVDVLRLAVQFVLGHSHMSSAHLWCSKSRDWSIPLKTPFSLGAEITPFPPFTLIL